MRFTQKLHLLEFRNCHGIHPSTRVISPAKRGCRKVYFDKKIPWLQPQPAGCSHSHSQLAVAAATDGGDAATAVVCVPAALARACFSVYASCLCSGLRVDPNLTLQLETGQIAVGPRSSKPRHRSLPGTQFKAHRLLHTTGRRASTQRDDVVSELLAPQLRVGGAGDAIPEVGPDSADGVCQLFTGAGGGRIRCGVYHPGGNPGANLKSISHRCCLFRGGICMGVG